MFDRHWTEGWKSIREGRFLWFRIKGDLFLRYNRRSRVITVFNEDEAVAVHQQEFPGGTPFWWNWRSPNHSMELPHWPGRFPFQHNIERGGERIEFCWGVGFVRPSGFMTVLEIFDRRFIDWATANLPDALPPYPGYLYDRIRAAAKEDAAVLDINNYRRTAALVRGEENDVFLGVMQVGREHREAAKRAEKAARRRPLPITADDILESLL